MVVPANAFRGGCLLPAMLMSLAACSEEREDPATARALDRGPRDDNGPVDVLMIVVDTLRADALGCYGSTASATPFVDRLAEEGVVFEHAHSAASWTVPSMASLFTGLLPVTHGCLDGKTGMPPESQTLAECFLEEGYFTAAVISNPHLARTFGFDRGFEVYEDRRVFERAERNAMESGAFRRKVPPVNEVVTGELVLEEAERILEAARESSRPSFLLVHFFDPHDSYLPPSPFRERFVDPHYDGTMDGQGILAMRDQVPGPKDLAYLRSLYTAEVAYTDDCVRRLMEKVRADAPRPLLTLLLSDHGESFGERGKLHHGNDAHVEETHVPLILHAPGLLPGGRRIVEPVCLVDLFPALRDLAATPSGSRGDGLLPSLLAGSADPPGRILHYQRAFGLGGHWVTALGSLRLHATFVERPSDPQSVWRLFDLRDDPAETRDVTAAWIDTEVYRRLRTASCEDWDRAQEAGSRFHHDAAFSQLDAESRRRLFGLGYLPR